MSVTELYMNGGRRHDALTRAYATCLSGCPDPQSHFETVRNKEVANTIQGAANFKYDLGIGTWWQDLGSNPALYIYRSHMKFPVPAGTSTSGMTATLKIYVRSDNYSNNGIDMTSSPAVSRFSPIATLINAPITMPDLQVFGQQSFGNTLNTTTFKKMYSQFTDAYSSQVSGITSTGGWLEISLNADALRDIESAAGDYIHICIREYSHDVANSEPDFSNRENVAYFAQIANNEDPTYKPRLVIAPAGFNHNLIGLAKSSISKVNDISMASPQQIEKINDIH